MKISGPTQAQALRLESAPVAALLQRLRPGDTFRVEVLGSLGRGQWRLAFANTELLARTQVPLKTGAQLTVRVEKGLPDPLLKIIPRRPMPQATEAVLRHALSRQLAPGEVQRQLQQMPIETESLPPAMREAVRLLNGDAAPLERLRPAAIRKALRESGLFLETSVAAGLPPPPSDRKLLLLRLLRQLAQPERLSPPQAKAEPPPQNPPSPEGLLSRLRQLVEASVARIQYHQTAALTQEEPNRLIWQFDLPLQIGEHRDALPLRIVREPPSDSDRPAPFIWKVHVLFDFVELGSVSAGISLRGEQVSCAFRSEKPATARRIEQALPDLRETLQDIGLEVSAVTSLTGSPPDDPMRPLDGLVDEKA